MPNRILREGILTSPRMARLSAWPEEVFYRRLMSVVDDFGRYYADAGLLRAACYPRQLNKVSDSDIGKWLTACVNAALVRVYPAEDGESYLQLLDFRQQARAKHSRFPGPHDACLSHATQEDGEGEADAPVFGGEDVFGDEGEGGPVGPSRQQRPSCPHRSILALWAEILPDLPQHNPDLWTGGRADALRARWKETAEAKNWTTQEAGIAYFRKLFRFIALSAFLCGRAEPREGKRPFFAELEWVVTARNWPKVIEGKYHEPDEVAHRENDRRGAPGAVIDRNEEPA